MPVAGGRLLVVRSAERRDHSIGLRSGFRYLAQPWSVNRRGRVGVRTATGIYRELGWWLTADRDVVRPPKQPRKAEA